MEIVKIDFPVIGDERGSLVALEQLKNIPFEIKRVYYMYDLQNDLARGFHAHKELQQILICLNGSCKVLLDNGKEKQVILLDKPNSGLLIDTMIWHEMFEFSDNCSLIVIASDYYNEDDYYRNYEAFLEAIK
ncbi:sugar 3,4-ketoisomerase [Neobacillus drentensis]|uniref:sugar 3,4-ketoisomerase n=1 Tax=Neobacillus drentensis TaxID=220684 RepID=UPI002FFDCCD1